jgi:hypothetical protein
VREGNILLSTGDTLREVETGGLDLKDTSGFREAREVDEFGNTERPALRTTMNPRQTITLRQKQMNTNHQALTITMRKALKSTDPDRSVKGEPLVI